MVPERQRLDTSNESNESVNGMEALLPPWCPPTGVAPSLAHVLLVFILFLSCPLAGVNDNASPPPSLCYRRRLWRD